MVNTTRYSLIENMTNNEWYFENGKTILLLYSHYDSIVARFFNNKKHETHRNSF